MKKNNDESLFVEEEYIGGSNISSNNDIEDVYREVSNISPFVDYINNNDIDSALNMLNRCDNIHIKEKDEMLENMKNKLKC